MEKEQERFRLGDLVSDKRNQKLGIVVGKQSDSVYPGGMQIYKVRQAEKMCCRWRFEISIVTSVAELEKESG